MANAFLTARPEYSSGPADTAVIGFSWFLVIAIGLSPVFEASLDRSPSVSVPMAVVFFLAVGSGVFLRRRYTWFGLVLHIYGQISIWLSLFVLSLAIAAIVIGKF